MNFLKSLRIHAHIEELTPADDGQWVWLKLKFDRRDDVQGECALKVWSADAHHYYVGQELCGVPGSASRTDGSLRIRAHIEKVSAAFDKAKWVELRTKLIERADIKGSCRFRLWPSHAVDGQIGEEVCFVFTPLEVSHG